MSEFRQTAFDFGFDEPAKKPAPTPPVSAVPADVPVSEEVSLSTPMPAVVNEVSEVIPVVQVLPTSKIHVTMPTTMPKTTRGRKPKAASSLPKQPGKRGRKSFKEMNAEVDLINIPDDEVLFQKQYYSIGEVAEMFHVNYSLLRLWANEFDGFLQPKKNRKGDRFFRPVDVKNIHMIYHLLREKKYTMEGAKDYIKNQKKKADQQFEITVSLQKLKAFLLELKANM
ncbi:MerR family transcriptional regulator [Pinibacter soli]|nr:MerR family transcriptional regulator [Pinibacter soli]